MLVNVPSEAGDADDKPQQDWGCGQGTITGLGVLIRDPHMPGVLIRDPHGAGVADKESPPPSPVLPPQPSSVPAPAGSQVLTALRGS